MWERFARAVQVLDPHLDVEQVRVDVQQQNVGAACVEALPGRLDLVREGAVDEPDLLQGRADRGADVGPTPGDRLGPLVFEREVVERAQYRSGTNDWCSIGGRMRRPVGSGRGGSFVGSGVTSS